MLLFLQLSAEKTFGKHSLQFLLIFHNLVHTLYHSHTEQISQNFPNMSTMTGCSVTEGMDISKYLQKTSGWRWH